MNILITTEFSDTTLELIRGAARNAQVHYYPLAGRPGVSAEDYGVTPKDQVPSDVLSQTDVLYTSGWLPAPGNAPRLKWVQAHSAGVDHFLRQPLFTEHHPTDGVPIRLTTSSGVHAINISEYIMMMMLALAHRLPMAFQMMQKRQWVRQQALFMPLELHGTTVGLVGYGAIGRQTAQLCLNFGMRVLALRRGRNTTKDAATLGVSLYRREQLPELLSQSDYVVLTAPLTAESYHMIDADAIESMKDRAFLVNISRGGIVDEDAMIRALRDGRLAGAALDVFAREPLPEDSPLWQMENVILTPHIAGITPNYERRAAQVFADNLGRFIAGQPLINQVDFARGY